MGNFSRNTFDRLKHYVGVRLQQGVPIVDADWNELQDIRQYELETFLRWFVGNGVPLGDNGFAINASVADNNFTIADGRCLVDGWEAVNDWDEQHAGSARLSYTSQPLFDDAALAMQWGVEALPPLTTPGAARTDIVYLDVWEREVGAGEDAEIVNPIIGLETSVRTKREWVVRVAEGIAVPAPAAGHAHYPIATLNREAGNPSIASGQVVDLRRTGLSLADLNERTTSLEAGKVDRAGDTVTGRLDVAPASDESTAITADALSDAAVDKYGVLATASGTGGTKHGLYGIANGDDTGNKYAVYGSASGDGGVKAGVFATSFGAGTKYGVQAQVIQDDDDAKYGVYATVAGNGGPKAGLVGATSGTGGDKIGVSASAAGEDTDSKTGVDALASGTDGSKIGVRAIAQGKGGTKHGAYCSAQGDGGTKYGAYCYASGDDSAQKFGIATFATGTGGFLYGVNGTASGDANNGYGVYGVAMGDTNVKCGVYGYASGDDTHEKHGGRFVGTGSGSGTNYGVRTHATGNGSTNYGIFAEASGTAATNYAGYFKGDVHVKGTMNVTGDVNKGGGTFLIDHVLDPDNKVLRHSFVESPEDLCLYRGKVGLDSSGRANVDMPDYFAALTQEQEATALLTPIGAKPCLLSYEWQKKNTRLVIHGEPEVEVSYLVLADRDDPVIRLLRKPVEQDKKSAGYEPGKRLYPEAYGQAPTEHSEPEAPPPHESMTQVHEDAKRLAEEMTARATEAQQHGKQLEAAQAAEQEMLRRARAKKAG